MCSVLALLLRAPELPWGSLVSTRVERLSSWGCGLSVSPDSVRLETGRAAQLLVRAYRVELFPLSGPVCLWLAVV